MKPTLMRQEGHNTSSFSVCSFPEDGVFTGQRERDLPYDCPEDLQPRWVREQKMRYDNVVQWCESFGAVKKIQETQDGSLHVYWHKWEVADTVSVLRVSILRV